MLLEQVPPDNTTPKHFVDLATCANVPDDATRRVIAEIVTKIKVSRDADMEAKMAVAAAAGEAIQVIIVHISNDGRRLFLVDMGYAQPDPFRSCYSVEHLHAAPPPPLPPVTDNGDGDGDGNTPSPVAHAHVPLPLCIPHRSMPTPRLAHMGFEDLAVIRTAYALLLDDERGTVPHGETWWAFADMDVSPEEDYMALALIMVYSSRSQDTMDTLVGYYASMLQRCMTADSTFLPRLRGAFPFLKGCFTADALLSTVRAQMLAMLNDQRQTFYAAGSELAHTLPFFVKRSHELAVDMAAAANE
jgi:hypothetical protein